MSVSMANVLYLMSCSLCGRWILHMLLLYFSWEILVFILSIVLVDLGFKLLFCRGILWISDLESHLCCGILWTSDLTSLFCHGILDLKYMATPWNPGILDLKIGYVVRSCGSWILFSWSRHILDCSRPFWTPGNARNTRPPHQLTHDANECQMLSVMQQGGTGIMSLFKRHLTWLQQE